MYILEKLSILETVFSGLMFISASIAAILAWRIGRKQNEINQKALKIQDFTEVFIMPQQIIGKDKDGKEKLLGWNLIIKNSSAQPIYLNRYVLNGISTLVGSSAIHTGDNSWYKIQILDSPCQENKLSLEVEFENYLGNKYLTRCYGKFENGEWGINSEKSKKI